MPPPTDNYLFNSFKSFVWMWFNVYSFNSLCEKDFSILSNRMNLFFNGLIAAYLLFFNGTLCALLVLSFFERFIIFCLHQVLLMKY